MNEPPEPRQAPRRRIGLPPTAPAAPRVVPATPPLPVPRVVVPAPPPPPAEAAPANPAIDVEAAAVAALLAERATQDPRFQALAADWARGTALPWQAPAAALAATRHRHRWRWILPALLALAALPFLLDGSAGAGVLLLLGAGTLFLVRQQPLAQQGSAAEERVAGWFFAALGFTQPATPQALSAGAFRDLGLLPDSTEEAISDQLQGKVAGVAFKICRLRLWRSERRGTVSTFDGQLLLLDSPVAVERPLFLSTRGGPRHLLAQLVPRGLPPSESRGSFADSFEVAGLEPDDEVPAALRRGLLLLAAQAEAPFRAALFDRWIYLALDTPRERPDAPLARLLHTAFDPAAAVLRCLARYDALERVARAFWPPEEAA